MNPETIAEIRAAAEEIRALMQDDDDAAFLDTLEGQTDIMELVDWVIRKTNERKASIDACAALAKRYRERQAAHEASLERLRGVAGSLLAAADVAKIARPGGTVSFLAGRPRVEITDADEIPTQLCRVKREPDKTAIMAQMDAGVVVPGAKRVIGERTVVVR